MAAVQAQRLDELAVARPILAPTQTLSFVDALAVFVQRSAALRRIVAGDTVAVAQSNHRRQRERRPDTNDGTDRASQDKRELTLHRTRAVAVVMFRAFTSR